MDFPKAMRRILDGKTVKRVDPTMDDVIVYLKRGDHGLAYGYAKKKRQAPTWTMDPAELLLDDMDATDWKVVPEATTKKWEEM